MSTIEGTLEAPPAARETSEKAWEPGRASEDKARAGRSPCGEILNAKARKILDGARSAFQELGYEGSSVDEIARRAGVSKPTLYTYFGDKQALFAASFTNQCRDYADEAFRNADFGNAACVETAMRQVVREVVSYLLTPQAQAMFRTAVAEVSRFPELGRSYYAAGPAKAHRQIASLLHQAVAGGVLAIEDIDLAAHQLMSLCKAELFMKRAFSVIGQPAPEDVDRVADGAVKLFFDGYRKR